MSMLFLRHRNAKSPPGQARRVVRQSSLTFMVPHGPVTKSQSDIMPNVAHNGRANTFYQLINPPYTLYFVTFQRTFQR